MFGPAGKAAPADVVATTGAVAGFCGGGVLSAHAIRPTTKPITTATRSRMMPGKISRARPGRVEIFSASPLGELRSWDVLGTVTLHDTRDRMEVAALGHPRCGMRRIVARRYVDQPRSRRRLWLRSAGARGRCRRRRR